MIRGTRPRDLLGVRKPYVRVLLLLAGRHGGDPTLLAAVAGAIEPALDQAHAVHVHAAASHVLERLLRRAREHPRAPALRVDLRSLRGQALEGVEADQAHVLDPGGAPRAVGAGHRAAGVD